LAKKDKILKELTKQKKKRAKMGGRQPIWRKTTNGTFTNDARMVQTGGGSTSENKTKGTGKGKRGGARGRKNKKKKISKTYREKKRKSLQDIKHF